MKLLLTAKIFLVLLISFSFVQINFAQEPPAKKSAQNQTERAEENSDRLPFMQNRTQKKYEPPSTGSLLLKTLGAMILIVGLIFAGAWVLKKLGYGAIKSLDSEDTPALAILSKVSTGNGQTLSIVKFGERTLLIGSTQNSFDLLAEENETHQEPRSVAEMLADEEISFQKQLENAQENLAISVGSGGQI